jgi:hypothetical protein
LGLISIPRDAELYLLLFPVFAFLFFMMASLVLLHGNGQEGMDLWDLLCMGLGFIVELLSRPRRACNKSINHQKAGFGLLPVGELLSTICQ